MTAIPRLFPLLALLFGLSLRLAADQFGDFTYTSDGTSITISDYPTTAVGVVDVPATIAGLPVARIGDFAFYNCNRLTGVNLPSSIGTIGKFAFYGCTGFTSVTVPSGVTGIADFAFFGCSGLTSASFRGNAPAMGSKVFGSTAAGFTVSYFEDATGFAWPIWIEYRTVIAVDPAAARDILAFDFGTLGPAAISGTDIALTVSFGTDVTALAPSYTVSPNAAGNPASGTTRNFTTPQTYTVTAENGMTKNYRVTVLEVAGFYWDGGTADIGALGDGVSTFVGGDWGGTLRNWDQGDGLPHAAWRDGEVALFGGPFTNGTKTVALVSDVNVKQIKILTGTTGADRYDIGASGGTSHAITFSGNYGAPTPAIDAAAVPDTHFNAKITGTINGGLVVSHGSDIGNPGGTGSLSFTNAGNDFVGDVTLLSGNLQAASSPFLGGPSNKIVLKGGALFVSGAAAGATTVNRAIRVDAASGLATNAIDAGIQALELAGTITGSGNLTRSNATTGSAVSEVRLQGDLSGYTGTFENLGGVVVGQTTATSGGAWKITGGTLRLGAPNNDVIASGGGMSDLVLTVGTLDLNGRDETINGLAGAIGTVQNGASGTLRTLTLGDGNASATFGGAIRDNPGAGGTVAITKIGGGTQTLTGSNTYTGPTQALAGVLACTSAAALAPTDLKIAAAAVVALNFSGTQTVPTLEIAGVPKPSGVYGATGSGAGRIDDVHFSGTGKLNVLTGPLPPLATTGAANWDTSATVTLTGTVNPNGFATTAQFEYGTTTAYGTTKTVTLSPNNGITVLNVAVDLGVLPAGTTYHYRLTATSANGTPVGVDRTFVTERTSGEYKYTTADSAATITGYTGSGEAVTIPSTLNGLPVTAIGYQAFFNKTTLKSVSIPAGVTRIGAYAFADCTGLTSTVFLGNAPTVGSSVFANNAAGFTVSYLNSSTGFTTPAWQGYPAALAVSAAIANHPASIAINSGGTTTLTVTASGTAPLSYQWYQGASGTTTAPVGVNSASFTTPALATTTSYWVKVSNAVKPVGVNSSTAMVTVNQLFISDLAADWSNASNPNGVWSLRAGSTLLPSRDGWGPGGFPTSEKVWSFGGTPAWCRATAGIISAAGVGQIGEAQVGDIITHTDDSSGGQIGASTATWTSPISGKVNLSGNVWATRSIGRANHWSLIVGGTVISEGDVSRTNSSRAAPVLLSSGTGGAAALSQVPVSVGDVIKLQIDKTTTYGDYVAVNLTITNGLIATHPLSKAITSGTSTTLRVTATGAGPFTYQWYQGASGTSTTPVGTNSALFTTPVLSTTTSYWVKVTNAANPTGVNSNTATVTVNQPAAIANHPASTTINSGSTTTLTVTASGTAPFTYRWYQGNTGTTTTPVGVNSASFTTPALATTTSYWVKVTNAANPTGANSNTAVITVTAELDYVSVGNPGNLTDPATGGFFGAVAYEYKISKDETTIGQYCEFLNAVAKSDPYALYSTNMASVTYIAGIFRAGGPGSYSYAVIGGTANKPITFVSWFDVARFCNWLHNGKGNGSTEIGAYTLNGALTGVFTKNAGATVWIPTENEWYKAAYYDPSRNAGAGGYWAFPNQRDSMPGNTPGVAGAANYYDGDYVGYPAMALTDGGAYGAGSASYYGTNDQGGNVYEWNDAELAGAARGIRGGAWNNSGTLDLESSRRYSDAPTAETAVYGFRVARMDESSALIVAFGLPGNLAVIDQSALTVSLTVPYGTNVTDFAPLFILAPGATCDRVSGATYDFTQPVIYTVHSSDFTVTKAYTVTVTQAPPPPAPEIVVEEPAGNGLASGDVRDFGSALVGATSSAKTLVVRNNGNAALLNLQVTVAGADAGDFTADLTAFPASLAPGASASVPVIFTPHATEARFATLLIASNDADENPFVIQLTGTGTAVPVITTQPLAAQTVAANAIVTLTAAASGYPVPTFQWYQGASGDTLSPVAGATAETFTTPALNAGTSYWVRATNEHGHADSAAAVITVELPPSANPNLAALEPLFGVLSPAFDPAVITYQVNLPNEVLENTLTPTVAEAGAVVTLNGQAVVSGTPGEPIPLAVGNTVVTLIVAAADGVTRKSYVVTFTRAAPVVVKTQPAEVTGATAATLKGSVTPHGVVSVYFEYGLTTAYGTKTAAEEFSGAIPVAFKARLEGLVGVTVYHYRAVAVAATGPVVGDDVAFTTGAEAPLAATGVPSEVTTTTAMFQGAVDPKGLASQVHFEYGFTTAYGRKTLAQAVAAEAGYGDLTAAVADLIPNVTYHCRIVATNAVGTTVGEDVVFVSAAGGPAGGIITLPVVTTGGVAGVSTASTILLGEVNPNNGTTLARFEFGLTEDYGRTTVDQGVGNGKAAVAVSLPADGLLPGTVYHYRLVATNSVGTGRGVNRTFTTLFPPPTAVTGGAEILTTTRARVNGSVRAGGATAAVFVDFGTDGFTFPQSVRATPASVDGDANTAVSAELGGLAQGVTYSYRVRAVSSGGTAVGATESFAVAMLSGLIQEFPVAVPLAERQGTVTVNLTPIDIASGWRLQGEQTWRISGSSATGLVSGDRVLEYRPVAGRTQPASEPLTVVSGGPPIVLDRVYEASGVAATGRLTVTLKPRHLADAVAEDVRLQWRLASDATALWLDSGSTLRGLAPGNHLVECKEIPNRLTPEPVSVLIANDNTTALTLTYQGLPSLVGTPPVVIDYDTVAGSADRPYAYVGQIRNDIGSGSGFVVRPGVVATAGHVVFDDGTLSAVTGLQWLFQRDRGTHEPQPQLPRGYYLMTGYAAQRALENTPGIASPESQALDAAALYFLTDAGRGGFSGYLASDAVANEFLLSPALKTLAGFPVSGIPAADRDRMHATPPAKVTFAAAFGGTYTTSDIQGYGGSSGGPLCVQYENGNFYPAAIYLGGSGQAVVRAIDGTVAELFGFAETSAATGLPGTGGILTQTGVTPVPTPAGALLVLIEPAAARAAGAGWRLRAQAPYQASNTREEDLDPNTYTVEFATVPGFLPPPRPTVAVGASQLVTITFTYEKIILPPVITSADGATGLRNQPMSYQITALNDPTHYQLQGVLPGGMDFVAASGLISGTPTQTGNFVVSVGASNTSGSASRTVAIAALPVVGDQSLTAPFNQPLTYQITSSESGAGLTYTAADLPPDLGLTLEPSSGKITGTPTKAGTFVIPVSVTVRSATGTATLTLNVTDTAPVITLQPVGSRTLPHGAITTLEVAADGLPTPGFQWYEGNSGDTSRPVNDATKATFTTPPLTAATRYWARASSISGSADSTAASITVLPSSNASLANLFLSAGTLSPAFNASIAAYAAAVHYSVSDVSVTAMAEVAQTTVRINGTPVALDTPSSPVALAVGDNTLVVTATAGDGTAVKTYTIILTRAAPASGATGDASAVTDRTATLEATVIPNGPVIVSFEYGTSPAYGDATPPQELSGNVALPVRADLTGLVGNTVYHYRLVITSAAGPVVGEDRSFTTSPDQAVAATGNAAEVDTISATLVGAVATNNLATKVYFQIGTTAAYGTNTPEQPVTGGGGVTDVFAIVDHLVANAIYHYRVVATNVLGTVYGQDVAFQAVKGGPAPAIAAPEATTGAAGEITSASALLQGVVNPHNGTTLVHFEYGLTDAYGAATAPRGVGNGNASVNVAMGITGLQPGKTYHFRLVAENSARKVRGSDATFVTGSLSPEVSTGAAEALSSSSAKLNGLVRARGAEATVVFDVGMDGTNFPITGQATPATVSGELDTPVTVTLDNLDQHTTYYYRVRAVGTGGEVPGTVMSFKISALLGLDQDFGRELTAGERGGEVIVSLVPAGTGGWRFVGETTWRASNALVPGLATGEREIEFRPVAGYVQPERETLSVISGEAPVVIERFYFPSAVVGTASLQVHLAPVGLIGAAVPLAERAQWRLLEDADPAWRDSGTLLSGLMPGSYLVECKPVPGWEAPTATPLTVAAAQTRAVTLSYLAAGAPMLNPPKPVPFGKIATDRLQPYAHVGQVRGVAGTFSGFVVKRRVVATVAQAVFDEATLTIVPNLQWLPQRENGGYEPDPLAPRGCYIFEDYKIQRQTEASPGALSLESQNLNVAALYFGSDAGRGGYSGFLASDQANNEFLQSSAMKTLIGYPTKGVSPGNQGKMHATAPVGSSLALGYDRTYTTAAIRGYGGMAGGPFCVQYQGGAFFPAGIYVGGTTLGTVRAIDGRVVDLFTRAETSGNGGENQLGGGITQTSFIIGPSSQPGGIRVLIEPAAARAVEAGWRLVPESSYRLSGAEKTGLSAGSFTLQMEPLPGYQVPADTVVVVSGGALLEVTFTYLENTPLPVIASAGTATGTRGYPLVYQINASNAPNAYTLEGTLPEGLVFNSATGSISGTLQQAGTFPVTVGAANGGGAGTLPLVIVSRPSLADQRATVPRGQPFTWQLVSSESGAGVTYAAVGLPDGVGLDPATGIISGTPLAAGGGISSISVTKGGATGAALFTLTVTLSPLETWRMAHFGTPDPIGPAADTADPDGDGKINLDEYAADTNPKNAADFFRILTATKTATAYTVTAAGKKDRSYVMERSTAPGNVDWTNVGTVGPLQADGPVELTDSAPPPQSGFYRLRVTAP